MILNSTVIASLSLALLPPLAAPIRSQGPAFRAAQVENSLRTVGKISGQADTAYTLEERMRYWHVPGASFAVIDDFKVVFARGYGVTEFGGTTHVDTTTLFQAGSISKPVFATAALRLVEQGALALDEDVNMKLTSWQVPANAFNANEKVTLRRLLTHAAGLTVWGFPGYAYDKTVPSVVEVLDGKGNTAAVVNDTIPGARWLYSGGGYTVAQLLATDVAKQSFPALMQRLVLGPAGMSRSTYENPLPASHSRFAASGHEQIDTPVPGRYHTYPEMAAAGLWTTAPDLARWAIDLSRSYNGGKGVLTPQMAQQMIQKHQPTGPRGGNGYYGLGVGVDGTGDSIFFAHGGRDEGFVANFVMWPRLGKGFVILTNGVSGPLLSEVRRAFAETYGFGAPAPRIERQPVVAEPGTLAAFVGEYDFTGSPARALSITAGKGSLTVYNNLGRRSFALWPLGNDQFFDASTGTTFVFQREGGVVRTVRAGLPVAAPVGTRRTRSIVDHGWLVGCWERARPSGRIVERWSAPVGGIMAGVSTSIRDTTHRVTERLRLFYRGDTLIYEARPARQPMNEFKSTRISAGEIVWEDSEHDFPQKITYRRIGADSLLARVEGDRASRQPPIEYAFERTACKPLRQ
jgi:CubicO group peptidase (beta-lactamase class C family)